MADGGQSSDQIVKALIYEIRHEEAARHFNISRNLLVQLRVLSSRRGGPTDGRKYDATAEYSPEQKQWIFAAAGLLIRRVGEREARQADELPRLELGDPALPQI